MGGYLVNSRKNSIRKKYNLENFNGKLDNELQLQNGTNFVMQLSHEELDKLTVGNLESYTHSIENSKVKEWLKSLRFSYKREVEMNF